MKSIFLGNANDISNVYPSAVTEALICEAGLDPTVITHADLPDRRDALRDTEYIFSTWGMLRLNEAEIAEYFPNLKAVFYAAGSVQYFARPFLNNGVRVFSAWRANAVPVAEYAASQILLANKGFFQAARRYRTVEEMFPARNASNRLPGNYGCKVGIIGVGGTGTLTCQMLRDRDLEILAYDPFLPAEKAEALGIRPCSLTEIFSTCQTVSNHAANNEQTRNMFTYDLFAAMLPGATFINTGRGAQVVEDDLVRALQERPDLTAVLDVTEMEPPAKESPLFSLPNIFLTPHIAGSSGKEVCRMAEYMLAEFRRYISGEPTRHEVTAKMLETMA